MKDINHKNLEELDKLSWKAICGWPEVSGYSPQINGIDFSQLTRFFLWDKVSRSIRVSQNLETLDRIIPPTSSALGSIGSVSSLDPQKLRYKSAGKPVLYVPDLPGAKSRLAGSVNRLSRFNDLLILTHMEGVKNNTYLTLNKFKPKVNKNGSKRIFNAILDGLKHFNIELLKTDIKSLLMEINWAINFCEIVERELVEVAPTLILLQADNFPPPQVYILVARKHNIPTMGLQHGLDCEFYCLEEAYADYIAIWGPNRKKRYLEKSTYQPKLKITGNPEFDKYCLPERLSTDGTYWLWVTRPHGSEKCYSVSRRPQERTELMEAMAEALKFDINKVLVIRPHPKENVSIYHKFFLKRNLEKRVFVANFHYPLTLQLQNAELVITEDSTAGLEAMFFGKKLIHAHFCKRKPVLPYVEYSAALPGFSRKEILENLIIASRLEKADRDNMFRGQRRFIEDFAGPVDGCSMSRVTDFVRDILHDKT